MKELTIAIDGYSSTGKSTLAKELAKALGYIYIDTGAMYRAVTLSALRHDAFTSGSLDQNWLNTELPKLEISFDRGPEGQVLTLLNGENVEQEIRQMEVSSRVSEVAAVSEVRRFLVAQQQAMGALGGAVLDGRDIGTVVFPNAELKIFMTASPEVRTQRRYQELIQKGERVTHSEVQSNLLERDRIDSSRSDSPLLQADDALLLDNSTLTREEQFDQVLRWARERMS